MRAHWEKQLGGPILWFGTTLEGIADYLEKLATDPNNKPAAAAAPAAPAAPTAAPAPAVAAAK